MAFVKEPGEQVFPCEWDLGLWYVVYVNDTNLMLQREL